MKTIKMLPYSWKIVGWVLLLLSLLLFVVCFRAVVNDLSWNFVSHSAQMREAESNAVNDAFGSYWASSIFVIFFTVGVVLLAFAQERYEDERIAHIRQQALARTVILYLFVLALNLVANLVLGRMLSMDSLVQVMLIKRTFLCVPAFILYYLLIFKLSLWSENKKLSRDEE